MIKQTPVYVFASQTKRKFPSKEIVKSNITLFGRGMFDGLLTFLMDFEVSSIHMWRVEAFGRVGKECGSTIALLLQDLCASVRSWLNTDKSKREVSLEWSSTSEDENLIIRKIARFRYCWEDAEGWLFRPNFMVGRVLDRSPLINSRTDKPPVRVTWRHRST